MRQPLEDGNITVSRAIGSINYPASFMLVAAMNPCPCGFLGDPQKECACTPLQIQRYRSNVSGPLLDRIDIQVEVPTLPTRSCARYSTLLQCAQRGRKTPGERHQQTRPQRARTAACSRSPAPSLISLAPKKSSPPTLRKRFTRVWIEERKSAKPVKGSNGRPNKLKADPSTVSLSEKL